MNTVESDIIPDYLKEEVQQDNSLIEEENRKMEEAKLTLPLRIKCEGQPVLNINVKKTDTMQQVLEKIHEQMSLRENFTARLKNCRLRKYDIPKQTPTSSFQNHGDKPISTFNLFYGTVLYLETKENDEEWKEVKDYITVYITPYSKETNDFTQCTSLKIATDQPLLEIKKEIEKLLLRENYPYEKLNLVVSRHEKTITFDNEKELDRSIEAGLDIVNSDIVYVEVLESFDSASYIIAKLEDMKYCFDVYVNSLEDPNRYTVAITADKRKTVRELKETIAKVLKIDVDSFRLCSKTNFQPLKEELLVSECPTIREYEQLHVEKGSALKEGEYIIQLYVHLPWLSEKKQEEPTQYSSEIPPAPEADVVMTCEPPTCVENNSTAVALYEPSDPVFSNTFSLLTKMNKLKEEFRLVDKVVVKQNETLREFKKRIHEQFFSNVDSDQYVPIELMRLRTKMGVFLQKILVCDDKTLKENIPDLANNKQILVQIQDQPESLKEGEISVIVQRWLPAEWKFFGGPDAKFEVVIPRQETLDAGKLKSIIFESLRSRVFSDVSEERFEKLGVNRAPGQFDLFVKKECIQVAVMNFEELDTLKDLFKPPFILKQDDILIVKMKDEEDKYNMDEYKNKQSTAPPTATRVVERALTIKVLDRETEQKEKEEEEAKKKKEEEEAAAKKKEEESNKQNEDGQSTVENPKKKLKMEEET